MASSSDSPGYPASRGRRHSSEQAGDLQDGQSNSSASPRDQDTEKASQGGASPPTPVHFFHRSLNTVRKQVFLAWARITLILCIFILSVLSIYWAVQFRVNQNLSSLLVYVVDFDGQVAPYNTGQPPLIGPAVVQAARMQVGSSQPHLGFAPVPPSMFNGDPLQVRQAIYNYAAWAAIVVNPNATALLHQAIAQGNTSYDPNGAAQIIYVEARDQDTIYDYVMPSLTMLETEITATFGEMWAQMLLKNASDPTTLQNMQKVPQAINPAMGFSTFNLRPFSPPVATPAITIGLIYLIIISFFSFAFYLPIHMKFIQPQGHPPLHFWQLIAWRWIATISAYFFLSLCYSLISLAFQIPFRKSALPATEVSATTNANEYGQASFVVYWMLNYVGMIALGMACENVAMVIGQPWMALWLIFWVITNVSTSFYEIALSPHWYYWGYAWPLHNIVEGSRTIIFNVHSRIGLNFGVLFAWCAVNTALFPLCCYFMRWKTQRQTKKEAESKE